SCFFFFFQAEDGIRDFHVTGVQTCALPIWWSARRVDGGRKRPRFLWTPGHAVCNAGHASARAAPPCLAPGGETTDFPAGGRAYAERARGVAGGGPQAPLRRRALPLVRAGRPALPVLLRDGAL